jgi:thiamine pyrophosphate-dependent acetolactate synthase large subunit-like protein
MARLRLPILVVVANNRQYGNSVEHAIRIAELRGRDPGNRYVGTGITDPDVDFTWLARSFGVWGTGPVSDPADLGPALRKALDVVHSGRPALVDVLVPGF